MHLNGGGLLGRFSATNGATQSVLSSLDSHEGGIGAALLVSLMDHLEAEGAADREALIGIVSRSRSRDCLPSVRAAEILLNRGDTEGADEAIGMSEGSMEVAHRSLAIARIRQAEGRLSDAREAALSAVLSDPDCREAYGILAQVDPEGGWPQRLNIQDIVSDRRPDGPAGTGKFQNLYQIYYEWFRGNREAATDMLVGSHHYRDRDPEYLLASARMSVDERDWHSARMMYDNLMDGAPSFLLCEAAEVRMASGDPAGALELYSQADGTSPRVMRGIVSARIAVGDRTGAMESLRSYLDSEWAGSDEWLGALHMLLDRGMEAEASGLLDEYVSVMGADSMALTIRSVIVMRAGEYPLALSAANEAVRKDRDSIPARAQRARMLFLMGKAQGAERECERILAADPENRDALELLRDMRPSDGEEAVEIRRRVLDADPDDPGAMISLAEAIHLSGQRDTAMDMYRKALRTDGSADTYERAISSMISFGMHTEALYVCREAEKAHPGAPRLMRLRGNAEYMSGQYQNASASYAEAAGLDPGNPVLWHSKGMADEMRGDLESAEESYGRAASLDPDEPEYWISLAAVREAQGDDRTAVEHLNHAIDLDPGYAYPLVRKAGIFARNGRAAEAVGLLEMAWTSDRSNPRILGEEMAIRMSMGDLKGAVGTFERIPGDGADTMSVVNAAECYAALGRASEASALVDRRLASEPDSVPLLKVKTRLLMASGDRRNATATADRLLALAPDDPEARLLAAEAGKAPGDDDLEHIHEPEPEPEPEQAAEVDVEALRATAASLAEAGDIKGAMREIDLALAADPADSGCIALKAGLLLDSGDADGASFMLATAVSSDPGNPELHLMMGRARAARGDTGGAVQEFDAAISLGMDDAEVHAMKGMALEAAGLPDRAAECYSAAVSRDPGRLDLAERLAGIMYSRRELMAADGMLNRVLRRDPKRVSAILMKAEIALARKDDAGVMSAYALFAKCPSPGPENTVRMVRILEDAGHSAEARSLVEGRQSEEPAGDSVKRYAEKALRRAYATKSRPTDPDVLEYIDLDPDTSHRVAAYLSEQRDYGHVSPGTEGFAEMERRSHDAVMKLGWKDLESEPRLPLEAVFVQCGCRDADEAKELVAYIHKAMLIDIGRKSDPRLTEMSMGLPKGLSVYDVMRECDLGVYEARVVLGQVI